MRTILPVAAVTIFGLVVRYAWKDVDDAIRQSAGIPHIPVQQPVYTPYTPYRPPVVEEEEPVEDDREFVPGEVLPPAPKPARRNQYADPRTPPKYVHPAERVLNPDTQP